MGLSSVAISYILRAHSVLRFIALRLAILMSLVFNTQPKLKMTEYAMLPDKGSTLDVLQGQKNSSRYA